MHKLTTVTVLLLTALMAGIGFAQDKAVVFDPEKIAAYQFEASRADLAAMEEKVRNSSAADYPAIEKELLKALDNPKATAAGKQFACRMLRYVGSEACLPAMKMLLKDDELSHMARFVVQEMDSPEVDELFREILGEVNNKIKIGIIGSIGARRDGKAVSILAKLINDKDEAVASAALSALGRIGDEASAKALAKAKVAAGLQNARDDSYLMCADNIISSGGDTSKAETIYRALFDASANTAIRIAALRGLTVTGREKTASDLFKMLSDKNVALRAAVVQLIIDMPGDKVTKAFADGLSSLANDEKVVALNALAERCDKAAGPRVAELLEDNNEAVRTAALRAAGSLCDAGCVDKLIAALKIEGAVGESAADSLNRLRDAGVDAAIMEFLKKADSALKPKLINCIAARRYREAVPVLFESAKGEDGKTRISAIKALAFLADNNDIPQLLVLLSKVQSAGEGATIEETIQNICLKNDDKELRVEVLAAAYGGAEAKVRSSILKILGRLGGKKALEIVRSSFKDEALNNDAFRAMVEFQDSIAADDILNLAKTEADQSRRILALRGYVRLAGNVGALESQDKAITMLDTAMSLAGRPEDKKLVIGELGNIKSEKALDILESCLQDPDVNEEAVSAILKNTEKPGKKKSEKTASLLTKIIATCKNEDLVKTAESRLAKIKASNGGQ